MKTPEELIVYHFDRLIGAVKAREVLETRENMDLAYNLILHLCDGVKVGIWKLVDSENKRIDRGVNSLLVQVIEQIQEYKRHPYILEEEIPFCDEFIETVQAVKDEYLKLKEEGKLCRKQFVLIAR